MEFWTLCVVCGCVWVVYPFFFNFSFMHYYLLNDLQLENVFHQTNPRKSCLFSLMQVCILYIHTMSKQYKASKDHKENQIFLWKKWKNETQTTSKRFFLLRILLTAYRGAQKNQQKMEKSEFKMKNKVMCSRLKCKVELVDVSDMKNAKKMKPDKRCWRNKKWDIVRTVNTFFWINVQNTSTTKIKLHLDIFMRLKGWWWGWIFFLLALFSFSNFRSFVNKFNLSIVCRHMQGARIHTHTLHTWFICFAISFFFWRFFFHWILPISIARSLCSLPSSQLETFFKDIRYCWM